jgi:hypothetical protein
MKCKKNFSLSRQLTQRKDDYSTVHSFKGKVLERIQNTVIAIKNFLASLIIPVIL